MRFALPDGTETAMLNRIKRLMLCYQLYSANIAIDGQTKALALVTDPATRFNITAARAVSRQERTRLRAAYNATFLPGQRAKWEVA